MRKRWIIVVKGEHSGIEIPLPWIRFWTEHAAFNWIGKQKLQEGVTYMVRQRD